MDYVVDQGVDLTDLMAVLDAWFDNEDLCPDIDDVDAIIPLQDAVLETAKARAKSA